MFLFDEESILFDIQIKLNITLHGQCGAEGFGLLKKQYNLWL